MIIVSCIQQLITFDSVFITVFDSVLMIISKASPEKEDAILASTGVFHLMALLLSILPYFTSCDRCCHFTALSAALSSQWKPRWQLTETISAIGTKQRDKQEQQRIMIFLLCYASELVCTTSWRHFFLGERPGPELLTIALTRFSRHSFQYQLFHKGRLYMHAIKRDLSPNV